MVPLKEYADFVLLADADDVVLDARQHVSAFSIQVFDSPVGQGLKEQVDVRRILAQESGDVEGSDERAQELVDRIDSLRRGALNREEQIRLGIVLGQLLLPPTAQRFFEASRSKVANVRLRLRLPDALSVFPWEYIYLCQGEGTPTYNNFVALDPRFSIVRHEALPVAADWSQTTQRRILMAMASPGPYDTYPMLTNLPDEQQRVRKAMATIQGASIDFVPSYQAWQEGQLIPSATQPGIVRGLDDGQRDIFHFSGHGDVAEEMDPQRFGVLIGEGMIVLGDEHNHAAPLCAGRLAQMLCSRSIRLVVLGACHSAWRPSADPWGSVARSLLDVGIPAVVAMQFTVSDKMAAAFSAAFYTALLPGNPIDYAVAAARSAMFQASQDDHANNRDWGVPVLYLRAPNGQIFSPIADVKAARAASVLVEQRMQEHVNAILPEYVGRNLTALRTKFLGAQRATVSDSPLQGVVEVYWPSDLDHPEDRPPADAPAPEGAARCPCRLVPFTLADRELFTGREVEINELLRGVGEERVFVLHGAAGVGKTSLVLAGAIPCLLKCQVAVAHLAGYDHAVTDLRAALISRMPSLDTAIPQASSLAHLVERFCQETGGSLILVLDQFERFVGPETDTATRESFIDDLSLTLQSLSPKLFRLLIVARSDTLLPMRVLTSRLSGLLDAAQHLGPLTNAQASQVLKGSLALPRSALIVDGSFIQQRLVPDLDMLTPDLPGQVDTWQLQVLCYWLCRAATRSASGEHRIDQALYDQVSEGKGAASIVASHVQQSLRQRLGWDEEQCGYGIQAIEALLAPDAPRAMTQAAIIHALGDKAQHAGAILQDLAKVDLLATERGEDERRYALAAHALRAASIPLVSRTTQQRLEAGPEMDRVWASWLTRDALATRDQLAFLAQAGDHLKLKPAQTMLLLRSAVAQDAWTSTYYQRAKRSDRLGQAIIQIEGDVGENGVPLAREEDVASIRHLLSLAESETVTQAAVTKRDPKTRQTAALALLAAKPQQAEDRLDQALSARVGGLRRWWRRAELIGALAEADTGVAEGLEKQRAALRLGPYLWRVWRRMVRQRWSLALHTAGAAIGVGIAVGLLRAMISYYHAAVIAVQFAINSYWGMWLGAALGLAFFVANLTDLAPNVPKGARSGQHAIRQLTMRLLLPTFAFTVIHTLVLVMNGSGLVNHGHLVLASAAVGAGIALAHLTPDAGRRHVRALLAYARMALVCLVYFVVERQLISAGYVDDAVIPVWDPDQYNIFAFRQGQPWEHLVGSPSNRPKWRNGLALADAVLVGAFLMAGLSFGHLLADWVLARIIRLSGDSSDSEDILRQPS